MIDSFTGKHRFLSNFAESPIRVRLLGEEHEFATVEHAFQASKILASTEDRMRWLLRILDGRSPGTAKSIGRRIPIDIERWNEISPEIMRRLLHAKFRQNPDLARRLLATGTQELVEANTWGDTRWGVCNGVGENLLGKALVEVREHLAANIHPKDRQALTVKCPECSQPPGARCVRYATTPPPAHVPSRVGEPTKRAHQGRQYAIQPRPLPRPVAGPSEAVWAVRSYDRQEFEDMRAWLRKNARVLF